MIIENYSPIKSIPFGWEWSTIGETCEVRAGNPAPQGEEMFDEAGPPFVRVVDMGAIGESWYISGSRDHLSTKGKSKLRMIKEGTILFTKSGASLLLNQRAILSKDMYVVSHIGLLQPSERVLSEWVYLWMSLIDFNKMAHATTLPSMPLSKVKTIQIPVPSINVQRSIINTCKEQQANRTRFQVLASSITDDLEALQSSLLQMACEGRLVPTEVEFARKEERDYEPADQLLERILAERRTCFEADYPGKKYREPVKPDIAGLPNLPHGWCWTNLDQLASFEKYSITDGPFGSNLKTEHYKSSGPRVIRLQNIGDGKFIDSRAHISNERYELLKKHSINQGDLVIASFGTDVPRACVIPEIGPAIVKADCIKFTTNENLFIPELLVHFLNSPLVRNNTKPKIHGIGRPRIGLTPLRGIPIPLPPILEQFRLLSTLHDHLAHRSSIAQLMGSINSEFVTLGVSLLVYAFSRSDLDESLEAII